MSFPLSVFSFSEKAWVSVSMSEVYAFIRDAENGLPLDESGRSIPVYSFFQAWAPIPIFDCLPPRPSISPRMSRKRPVQMASMARVEGSKEKFWALV